MNGGFAPTRGTGHGFLLPSLSVVSVLVLGLLFLAPAVSAAPLPGPMSSVASPAGPSSWPSTGSSWSNGVVLCVFSPTAPTASVSAADLADSGMTVGIASVEEVSASGAIVGTTPSSGMVWTVTNRSDPLWYDESYSATLRVAPSATAITSLGVVNLTLDFLLPISYVEGATENLSAVSMELGMSGWPWQASGDHLVVNLGLAPAFAGTEHFTAPNSTGTLVASVSNRSGRALEYFAPAAEGTVQGPTGPATSTAVAPRWSVSPSSVSVALVVGSSVAEFQSLNYTAHVGVFLPASIAGIPLADYAVVGAVAAVIVVGVGVSVQRARRRPSDLVYAEEEHA